MKCPDCDVTWDPYHEGKNCWVCGRECVAAPPQNIVPMQPYFRVEPERHEGERG